MPNGRRASCRGRYDRNFRPAAEKRGVTLGMGMTEKQGGTDVRANTTRAEAERGRPLPPDRPQMVLLRADVGRLPGARASEGRAHLLSDAALPSRRLGQRDPAGAAEGQARQPLECLGRGRVRRRRRLARRRGGAGGRHDPRNGDADAARLRGGERRADAQRLRGGRAPRPPSRRLRQGADRPAADDARARRHGARPRRGAGAFDAARGSLRHGGRASRPKPPMCG